MDTTISDRVFLALVSLYRLHPVDVARVCDEELDPSGALLGRIRSAVWPERSRANAWARISELESD